MAKAVVALLTLVMLGVWGWMAWEGYKNKTDAEFLVDEDIEYSLIGAIRYVAGLEEEKISGQYRVAPDEVAHGQANVRVALGAIVVLALTMWYAVSKEHGSLMSINIAVWVTYFTAVAHAFMVLVLLACMAWQLFVVAPREGRWERLNMPVYGFFLYLAVTLCGSVAVLRSLDELAHGSAAAMKRVAKWLTVLIAVGLPLNWVWRIPYYIVTTPGESSLIFPIGWEWAIPEFSLLGYNGVLWLAGCSALSLLLIGASHSNYRYD